MITVTGKSKGTESLSSPTLHGRDRQAGPSDLPGNTQLSWQSRQNHISWVPCNSPATTPWLTVWSTKLYLDDIFDVTTSDFVPEKQVPIPLWKLWSWGILGRCGYRELVPWCPRKPLIPKIAKNMSSQALPLKWTVLDKGDKQRKYGFLDPRGRKGQIRSLAAQYLRSSLATWLKTRSPSFTFPPHKAQHLSP